MQPLTNLADLKSRRPSKIEVAIEAWGGTVFVGKMQALEKLEVVEQFEATKDAEGNLFKQDAIEFAKELLARTLENAEGERLFDCDDGRAFLRVEDPAVLQPLLEASMRLNGLGDSKKN